jgi:hypothetical protein
MVCQGKVRKFKATNGMSRKGMACQVKARHGMSRQEFETLLIDNPIELYFKQLFSCKTKTKVHTTYSGVFCVLEDFRDQGFPRSTDISKKKQEKLLKKQNLWG